VRSPPNPLLPCLLALLSPSTGAAAPPDPAPAAATAIALGDGASVFLRPPKIKLHPDDKSARKELAARALKSIHDGLLRECWVEAAAAEQADVSVNLTIEGQRAPGVDAWDLLLIVSLTPRGGSEGPPVAERCAACTAARLDDAMKANVERLVPEERRAGRAQLSFETIPSGASLFLDGSQKPDGTTPFQRRVCGGRHEAVIQLGTRRQSIAVEVAPGRCEQVKADFSQDSAGVPFHHPCEDKPAAPPPVAAPTETGEAAHADHRRVLERRLGLTGLAVGGPALVAGIALWAIDGRPTCDPVPPSQQCRQLYATAAPGIALTVTGAALAAAGGVLLYLGSRAAPRAHAAPIVVVPALHDGGAGLVAGGQF
jgi:hypothetical protein